MNKLIAVALVLVMVLSLAACRMNRQEQTTEPATDPVTTTPATRPTDPPAILPDPTFGTNIPDEDVDDSHMADPTQDQNTDQDETRPELRRKMIQKR